MKTKPNPRHLNYNSYIHSDAWRSHHPAWLKAAGYRCTVFPWIRISRGHPYAIHHLNYRNLGSEKLGRDVLPISKFAHQWIIHGLLSRFKSPGEQRGYPNLAQRLLHYWMNHRLWVKRLLLVGLGVWLLLSRTH
jgi:hypothetical protein